MTSEQCQSPKTRRRWPLPDEDESPLQCAQRLLAQCQLQVERIKQRNPGYGFTLDVLAWRLSSIQALLDLELSSKEVDYAHPDTQAPWFHGALHEMPGHDSQGPVAASLEDLPRSALGAKTPTPL